MAESNNNTDTQHQECGALESAARNLVSLLITSMTANGSTRLQPNSGPTEPRNLTVQQEMTRSFPGYFKSNFSRGKKRCLTTTKQLKITNKITALNFYLLPKNTSHTPLPTEELELLQAGMGRKTVSLPEDSDHTEISKLLTETFPKMENLCGGWLLHKATGGSGQWKLTVIPPEAEGYTVKALRAVSAGGKATFYIVPLQETDTTPLPPDSQQFSKMPKKMCYQCDEVMPLQMLAVHIKTCKGKLLSDDTDECSDVELCTRKSKCKVCCPICNKEFPEDEITVHASLCGESPESTVMPAANVSSLGTLTPTPECSTKSMEDVLCFLQQQVDTTTEFQLCVDREQLPDRGILQWKRKKAASPVSTLKVVYIGESGIDTGALWKEFLTDMISGIGNRFFEGLGNHGKNPKYSVTDLDNENFRTIGEIMAVSLAQGGPAPAFLKEWCYNFLCMGEVDFSCLSKEDVADVESSLLISRVEDATDTQSLLLWADEIVSCGYKSQIKQDNKDCIIRKGM